MRRWLIAGGSVLATAVVAVAAVLALQPRAPGASGSPSPSAGASRPPSLELGRLEIGSYMADEFEPPFALLISDTGWTAYRIGLKYVGFEYDPEPQGHVDIGRVERVNTSGCAEDGPTVETGSTPLELWSALKTVEYMTVSQWDPTTIGGRSGLSMYVDISAGALAACSFGTGEVNVFPVGGETWRAHPGERIRIKAVEVEGKTVTVMLSAETAAANSVPELEAFFELADRLLKHLSF